MKKILFILLLLPFLSKAQFSETSYQQLGAKTTHVKVLGVLSADSAFRLPIYATRYLPKNLSKAGYVLFDSLQRAAYLDIGSGIFVRLLDSTWSGLTSANTSIGTGFPIAWDGTNRIRKVAATNGLSLDSNTVSNTIVANLGTAAQGTAANNAFQTDRWIQMGNSATVHALNLIRDFSGIFPTFPTYYTRFPAPSQIFLEGADGGTLGITVFDSTCVIGSSFPSINYFSGYNKLLQAFTGLHWTSTDKHFDLVDARGSLTYVDIQFNAQSTQDWRNTGETYLGLIGTHRVGINLTPGNLSAMFDVAGTVRFRDSVRLFSRIGSGTDSVYTKRSDGSVGAVAQSSIGGSIPTLQQVLTTGSTLTTDNTIDGGVKDLILTNMKDFAYEMGTTQNNTFGFGNTGLIGLVHGITSASDTTVNLTLSKAGNLLLATSSTTGTKQSQINIILDSIAFYQKDGYYRFYNIPYGSIDTTVNKPLAANVNGKMVRMNSWAQVGGGGGAGTVTSVDLAYGITGSSDPITTSGTVILDTTIAVNKAGAQVIAGIKDFTDGTSHMKFTTSTTTLGIYGPATSLTLMPKLSFLFNGDADAVQSAFAYNHDNTAWLFDAWYNGSNFVSSFSSSQFAWYKTGSELIGGYATTAKASTFASFNTTGGLRLAVNGNIGIGVAASAIAKFNVLSTTEQERILYDASNYVSTTVGSTGTVTYNAVGSGSAFNFSDRIVVTGFAGAYAAKTTTYSVTAEDYCLEATSGTFTMTLPTAVGISGKQFVITNSGSGVLTIATTSSQTFVNVVTTPTTLTLNQYGSVILISNNGNWLRVTSL